MAAKAVVVVGSGLDDLMHPESLDLTEMSRTRIGLNRKARLQIDRATDAPVLLYPEGVLLLNPTAAAIVELCDGQRTFGELVAALAVRYDVESAVLSADAAECLARLRNSGLLVLSPAELDPNQE